MIEIVFDYNLTRYSPSTRADIGRYACQHGIVAAASFYSKKLKTVSNTTVHSIKKAYLEEMRGKQRDENDNDVVILPWKKGGRPVLLREQLGK